MGFGRLIWVELHFGSKFSNFSLRIEILTVNRHRNGYNYVVRSLFAIDVYPVCFILSPEIITEGDSRERLFLLQNTPLGKKPC